MHIKEIIVEGFKSYASRTVIKGFDPQFNAITGLNGSGKSNILDAILFVLGLSQLSMARVNNLQELIYKFGHAGVTKAIVTLILDNSDKKNSPNGYEDFDTINITRQISAGKSKYFLNGHSESNTKIKNLFKSVQLNIDNPHFLVAQGRITKILNLKPAELISMLEETAGTSLYNDKKKESRRIMEKKEEKLREINELLKNEIDPQMEKLKKEKDTYLLWKSGEIQLAKLNKIISAFEYYSKTKFMQKLSEEITEIRSIDAELRQQHETITLEMLRLEKKTVAYEKEKRDSRISGEFQSTLEERFNEKQKQLTEFEAEIKNMLKSLDGYEKDLGSMEILKKENTARLAKMGQMLEFSNSTLKSHEQMVKEKKGQLDEVKRGLQAEGEGMEEATTDAVSRQLEQAEKKYQENENFMQRLKQRMIQIKEQIEMQRTMYDNSLMNRRNEEKNMEILHMEIEKLDDEINNFPIDGDLNILLEKKRKVDEEIMRKNHDISSIVEKNWQFQLKFRDPEPNFDRRRVRGKVFQLISAVDPKYIRALEQAAGGRLFNIIVDTETTAKMLMKKDCFSTHVNLIPNNKIQGSSITENVAAIASDVASNVGGFAIPANRLVDFDRDITNSIEFVFGNSFICNSSDVAKRIAFHPQIRRRCVTLDGDIFDPSGTLTGGYVDPGQSILSKQEDLNKINQMIEELRLEQKSFELSISKIRKDQEYLSSLKSDLEAKTLKLNLLKEKMKSSSNAKLQDKHLALENEYNVFEEQLEQLNDNKTRYAREVNELKQEKNNLSKADSSRNLKDVLTAKVKKLEGELAKLNEETARIKKGINKSELERENLDIEIRKLEEELQKGAFGYEELKVNYTEKKRQLAIIRKDFETLMEEKRKIADKIQSVDGKLNGLIDEKTKLNKKLEAVERDQKKYESLYNKGMKETREIQDSLRSLEKAFPFIIDEKDFFGVENTEYDFEHFDVAEKEKEYFRIKQEQQILQKRVNLKVEAMSEKVEKEFKDLLDKKSILQQDKLTLNVNMEELDKKKQEALEKCYLDVNSHFGKIFESLLPGAFAKVQKIEGKELSDGLELGVCFNGAWKSNISELSGGQKSLLALSFILSLLLYKPAPFYILDEIDAALDLSHTENIGAMISQHFSQSQFILISLKDGMFNNANVLFKTSFVDGVSKVDRVVLKTKEKERRNKAVLEEAAAEKENVIGAGKKRMILEGI